MNDNHEDKQQQTIGLLAASLGAMIELVSECRTAITERWPAHHSDTIELVGKIDAFLGPLAGKG